jgi:hypothetical protein
MAFDRIGILEEVIIENDMKIVLRGDVSLGSLALITHQDICTRLRLVSHMQIEVLSKIDY